MTPEQEQQKKRIDDALKAYHEALWAHKCTIEQSPKTGSFAMCPVCRKDFGWWCPKSPDNLCNYDPPGHLDSCQYCGDPEERK